MRIDSLEKKLFAADKNVSDSVKQLQAKELELSTLREKNLQIAQEANRARFAKKILERKFVQVKRRLEEE